MDRIDPGNARITTLQHNTMPTFKVLIHPHTPLKYMMIHADFAVGQKGKRERKQPETKSRKKI